MASRVVPLKRCTRISLTAISTTRGSAGSARLTAPLRQRAPRARAAVYEVARYRGDCASAASEGRRTASNANDVRPGEGIRAHRLRHGETKVRAVVRDKCRRHEEAHLVGGFVAGVQAV